MAEQDVLYSKEDGIAIVTLNRPDKLNALALEQQLRMGSFFGDIMSDDKVMVSILTGNGRGFDAGAALAGV